MATKAERCEELRDALKDARARLDPPARDSTFSGAQGAHNVDPRDMTPDADPGVWEDIRHLEQALREAGCEPE
ncbi:MAG: hypothetical protein GEU80_10020 [Dehalococcoidia bacterium]|nr:hypothetical protein [Dehalococcoidia bacterium]